jgi:periplasmic protein TonB
MHAVLTSANHLGGVARWMPLGAAALLAACTTSPELPPAAPAPAPQVQASPPAPVEATGARVQPLQTSAAATPRDYRRYGATRVYELNPERVYKGKMPPMLYAVGVLNVDIDGLGQVQRVDWMRAPRHAPEVMAEIERMVRAAAPYPAPARMGRVTWTDTWLWDRSGRFQLDTLTEGQLGQMVVEPPRKRR